MPGFVLQCAVTAYEHGGVSVGFTATKKIGNAVIRNRAKRRLRALSATVLPDKAFAAYDYVLIARKGGTVERAFTQMQDDLRVAIDKVHERLRT